MNDALFINILLLVCMYPVLMIAYYIQKNAVVKGQTM